MLDRRVHDLEEENQKLRQQVSLLESAKVETEEKIEKMRREVQEVKRHAIQNEQYSRRENIRIFGLKGSPGENIEQKVMELSKEIGVQIPKEEIYAAHRVPSTVSPQPVIVRFTNRDIKAKILKARRNLKGKGITIVEDLCHELQGLFNRVNKDERVYKAWSWNGKVFFTKERNGQVFTIEYGQPLEAAWMKKN